MLRTRPGGAGCRQTHLAPPGPFLDRPRSGSPKDGTFTAWQKCAEGAHRPVGRGSDGPGPPALSQLFVSQKILPISSIASRTDCPCFGSLDFFEAPASFVAFQNFSCRSGYFSRCSGLK